MDRHKNKFIYVFGFAGFCMSCLLMLLIVSAHVKLGDGWFTWVVLSLWPSSPLLMLAEIGGGTGGEIIAFLVSGLLNALIYALVGVLVVFTYRRSKARSM